MSADLHGALWVNDLARLAQPPELGRGYAIAEVRGGLLGAHLADATGVAEEEVRARFRDGVRAWACWHRPEAELVAWLWVSTGREQAPPLHQELRFADDECYGWSADTLPAHRGRGLFTALLQQAGWRMREAGYRWIWGGIEDDNLPSQRANAAAGYRPILRVTARRVPPARLRVRPADYADPELVARACRILSVPDPTSPLAPAAAHARR